MARSRKNDLVVLPTARATYGVVLLSHGSPDPRARLANDLLSRRVGHRLNAAVSLASLDHDKARLDGAVAHLQERDINEIVVVPLLLNVAYSRPLDSDPHRIPVWCWHQQGQPSNPREHATLRLRWSGDPTDGEAPQSRSLRVQVPAFQMPLRRFANRVSNELWSHRSSSHLACYPIESPARHVQLARSP